MTIQELNEFRTMRSEIIAMDKQIDDLCRLQTGAGNKIGAGRVSARDPTSPTERNALKITEIRERLEAKKEVLIDRYKDIEEWLDTVADDEVRKIVRYRVLLGYSWRATNRAVYGRPDHQYSYHRLRRYIENNNVVDDVE